MKRMLCAALAVGAGLFAFGVEAAYPPHSSEQLEPIVNPQIDFPAFLEDAQEVMQRRERRRISEADFIRMAGEPDTVVLDTRSAKLFEQLHVQGATHLNFSDFTKESLAAAIPSKQTRVLIYCNNNFLGNAVSFRRKAGPAALNIPTFIALHTYGYENVYELGPALPLGQTNFTFVGTRLEVVERHRLMRRLRTSSSTWLPISRVDPLSERQALAGLISPRD